MESCDVFLLTCQRTWLVFYSPLMDQLLNGYLAELPTILNNSWSGQYYKHLYRDGEWGSGWGTTK